MSEIQGCVLAREDEGCVSVREDIQSVLLGSTPFTMF